MEWNYKSLYINGLMYDSKFASRILRLELILCHDYQILHNKLHFLFFKFTEVTIIFNSGSNFDSLS